VYEDPVFYDRLERARVQATDRLAMIQQMGRLIQ
jgi:ATP-binding cassette, subfamily B, bacterial